MSYNGSGTFLINSTGQPVVANTVISATVFNALTADLASGLTNCITKDGQSTPTANIPMGSNKITGLANGTLINDAATLGQVQSTAAKLITVTGTDTITGSMSPQLTAYAAGQLLYFIANAANTGAVTINVDGLGAKAITRDGSTALAAGDINSGEVVVIVYDGTRFQMINAANSFGNTTINGTLTVTGNTGLQANVSITSALSVGGTFNVTGAATLGSTLSVTGKSDLPTVSTASINAAVAVVTTGTVTNLTLSSGTANGVLYLNASKAATSGSALVFDGTNLGIGGTANAYAKVEILGDLPSITTSIAAEVSGTFPSATTSNGYGFRSFIKTAAASFTLANLRHFGAIQGTIGAGSTVTNQYGYFVDSSLTGATNNYGFYSNIGSGSNRWNFYAAGTARNYFAGRTDVGNTRIEASNNFNGVSIESGTSVTVADGATVTLTSAVCGAVIVHVYDAGTGNGGVFFATYSTTVTKIAGDGEATDTGSTFAVYKSAGSHTLTFKNKYGGVARDFRIAIYAAMVS